MRRLPSACAENREEKDQGHLVFARGKMPLHPRKDTCAWRLAQGRKSRVVCAYKSRYYLGRRGEDAGRGASRLTCFVDPSHHLCSSLAPFFISLLLSETPYPI